jgi:DnaA family protein
MQQLLLELLPPPLPSFDNFVGGSNAEALALLRGWLATPREAGDSDLVFLLYGEAGSGRSHLLHASALPYFDAATDADLAALAGDDIPDDAELAVDHIDRLSPAGQVTLFNLFNRLRPGVGRLLVGADQPPQRLAVREDLRTRLGCGLIVRLHPLTDTAKLDALRQRAARRALPLSDEALDYLFRHAARDMGTLAALVDAIDRFSLQHRRPVTLPLLRQLLAAPTTATT